MTNGIELQVQYILAAITRRYVMTESEIPPDVLALKDEVMDIFGKAKQTTDPGILGQYERQLAEIRGSVAPSDRG